MKLIIFLFLSPFVLGIFGVHLNGFTRERREKACEVATNLKRWDQDTRDYYKFRLTKKPFASDQKTIAHDSGILFFMSKFELRDMDNSIDGRLVRLFGVDLKCKHEIL